MFGVHRVAVVYAAYGVGYGYDASLQIHVVPLQRAHFSDAEAATESYHNTDVLR